jgi:RNA polymerase sigma-70 factor (ECF subfamily)
MQSDTSRTSPTLLLRLRDLSDKDAWNEFLNRYGPKIYGWCRRFHLQEADATDVSQEVLAKLVKAMRSFDYNPARGSFRGWLKTVTNNAIRDMVDEWNRPGRGSGDSQVMQSLAAIQSPDALASLAAEIESQAEQEMLREAEERVRLRVKPHTWQAYRRTVVDGVAAAEVAAAIGMPVAEVYVAKSRVIKMLREEVSRMS